MDTLIQHNPAADTGTHREVNQRCCAASGAMALFGECGGIAVIRDCARQFQIALDHRGKGRSFPTAHMHRAPHRALIGGHRPPEANTAGLRRH